jgi:serine/threonine-protein kinase HipA
MRPKCSVRDDAWGLSIGKFPSVTDERPYTKGEVLALTLARRAGITAADARLVDSDGMPVTLVRRFDRVRDRLTGSERRLHYVSAATLMGVNPSNAGDHAYTELADAIRQHGADSAADLEELWRRMVFSILITNVDDHLQNHGFLHVHGSLWRLSPAFDLNPFPDRARELTTWISEEDGPAASIASAMRCARHFGVSPMSAARIVAEVEAAVAQWRAVAASLGFTPQEADSFADAFEHREREVARAMKG